MSLYKPKEEQTIEVEIKVMPDKRIVIDFYSDFGKFGTFEPLSGYILTPERLFNILKDKKIVYTDKELEV